MEKALLHMISQVNRRCWELEEECNLLRELLKPWPQKKTDHSKAISNENVYKEEPGKSKDDLSTEDKQALLKVEELLQKAQITRQRRSKQKSTLEHNSLHTGMKDNLCTTNSPAVTVKRPCETERAASVPNCSSHTRAARSQGSGASHSLPQAAGKSECAAVDKGCSVASLKSSVRAAQPRQSNKCEKLETENTKTALRPSQGRRPVSQSHRSARPGSGRNCHMPVHMTAPFKTEENLKMPVKRTMQSHLRPKNVAKESRPGSGLSAHSYSTLPAITKNKSSSQQRSCKGTEGSEYCTKELCYPDTASVTGLLSSYEFDNFYDNNAPNHDTEPASGDAGFSPVPSFPLKHCPVENPSVLERDTAKSSFTLEKNGPSLKIPSKLSKLVSMNNSLREQCSAALLLKRVSPEDAGQHFVERLQNEWEISDEMWTRVRAITSLRSHKILLDMLCQLDLASITGQSSYLELYRAKRMLEFVLSVFASLQDESDYLSQVQFKHVEPVLSDEKASPQVLPTNIFQPLVKADCGNWDVSEHLSGHNQWSQLKFAEDHFSVQLWLLGLIDAEWWTFCSSNERDPSVLQALYSLLSSRGEFLPAFVKNKTQSNIF